jgi:hypothetical protein
MLTYELSLKSLFGKKLYFLKRPFQCHITCSIQNIIWPLDSWVLIVKTQVANLILRIFFGHITCVSQLQMKNVKLYSIFFQRYIESLIWTAFFIYTFVWKIWDYAKIQRSKFENSFFHICDNVNPMTLSEFTLTILIT